MRLVPARWESLLVGVMVAGLAVSAYALATRIFPGALSANEVYARLRAPFDYWNAIGLTAALAVPPFLWLGSRREGHGTVGGARLPGRDAAPRDADAGLFARRAARARPGSRLLLRDRASAPAVVDRARRRRRRSGGRRRLGVRQAGRSASTTSRCRRESTSATCSACCSSASPCSSTPPASASASPPRVAAAAALRRRAGVAVLVVLALRAVRRRGRAGRRAPAASAARSPTTGGH